MELKHTTEFIIELHEFEDESLWEEIGIRAYFWEYSILYQGKPSKVTEEMAKEWMEIEKGKSYLWYKEYNIPYVLSEFPHMTAIDSFKSACTKDWIIITKKKI